MVMAYCNVNQFLAKRLIKKNNINNRDQVEKVFRSSAYLAWDNIDLMSGIGSSEISSTPSNLLTKSKYRFRQGYKSKRNSNATALEKDRSQVTDIIDKTLIPSSEIMDVDMYASQNQTLTEEAFVYSNEPIEVNNDPSIGMNIDRLFPSPGIVMKDLYEIYNSNRIVRERELAVLNYINLLFRSKN